MTELKEYHPHVYKKFMEGSHVIRRTDSGLDFPLILSSKSRHEKPQNKWWFDLWSWHDRESTSCLAALYVVIFVRAGHVTGELSYVLCLLNKVLRSFPVSSPSCTEIRFTMQELPGTQ